MSSLSLTNRSPSLTNRPTGGGGQLLKTRQTTMYHVGDDGDYEAGQAASYTVMTAGQFSGTTAIDTPHYAAATLTFAAADDSITDAAAGLVTFLDGDTIRVRGSVANDGVYTVAAGTGGVAGHFHVNEALADEAAGAYITICKRSTPSNNCVIDNVTGLMWKRYTTGGPVERVGAASTGTLNWYDTTTCFTLHPAAADLQMMTTGIKIVGGVLELPRYFVGMVIDPSGFANAVNNMPGYTITAVTANGGDLDLTLWTGTNTLIAEGAAGARDIRVVCRSIFAYCSSANAVSFGGYANWRVPNLSELFSLRVVEGASMVPNVVAFPSWAASSYWSDNNRPSSSGNAIHVGFDVSGLSSFDAKTVAKLCALVRG